MNKKEGIVFTPKDISDMMANQLVNRELGTVLEPSVGCGVLINALQKCGQFDSALCIDINREMIECAKCNIKDIENIDLLCEDFLFYDIDMKFDTVIANPPYIKMNRIPLRDKYIEHIYNEYGIRVRKNSSLYILFMIKCIELLKDNGMYSFIVPIEFMNSLYGNDIKRFIIENTSVISFTLIDSREPIFDNGLSSAVIVHGIKSDEQKQTLFRKINYDDLNLNIERSIEVDTQELNIEYKSKWTRYFFDGYIQDDEFIKIGELYEVNRGIETGHNSYFTLNNDDVISWSLENMVIPVITKASHVSPPTFTNNDFELLSRDGKKCYLLSIDEEYNNHEYVKYGVSLDIHKRYHTGHRNPWFRVERREIPRMIIKTFFRKSPQIILNESNCVTLTPFHNFYGENDKDIDKSVIMFMSSEKGSKHIISQSRIYGGRLYKLEPYDVKLLTIPDLKNNKRIVYGLSSLFDEWVNTNLFPDDSLNEMIDDIIT